MNLSRMAMAVALAGGIASGGELSGVTELRVAVCADLGTMTPGESNQIRFATQEASKIFAGIGVVIDWQVKHSCESSPDVIHVEFKSGTPEEKFPRALAFALPFQGTRIEIFYDRVKGIAQTNTVVVNRLLSYVLVHEITHILQGVAVHSASGIMKPRWTYSDHYQMRKAALAFTEHDVMLIYLGRKVREEKLLLAGVSAKR